MKPEYLHRSIFLNFSKSNHYSYSRRENLNIKNLLHEKEGGGGIL